MMLSKHAQRGHDYVKDESSRERVLRNGGLFMGLSRDTKTTLESYDPDASTWRFCEPTAGCDYLDAVISFDENDALTMDVKVRGAQHMLWTATREEERDSGTLPLQARPDRHR